MSLVKSKPTSCPRRIGEAMKMERRSRPVSEIVGLSPNLTGPNSSTAPQTASRLGSELPSLAMPWMTELRIWFPVPTATTSVTPRAKSSGLTQPAKMRTCAALTSRGSMGRSW